MRFIFLELPATTMELRRNPSHFVRLMGLFWKDSENCVGERVRNCWRGVFLSLGFGVNSGI